MNNTRQTSPHEFLIELMRLLVNVFGLPISELFSFGTDNANAKHFHEITTASATQLNRCAYFLKLQRKTCIKLTESN